MVGMVTPGHIRTLGERERETGVKSATCLLGQTLASREEWVE